MSSARSSTRRVLLLPLAALLVSGLACGGFQVRVTPTPKAETAEPLTTEAATEALEPTLAATMQSAAEGTATPAPTQTPPPPTAAAPATRQARVTASGGLNVRDKATAKGKALGRLAGDAIVTVLEGPIDAESYSWYRVDNGQGLVGWVAAGPKDDAWLVMVQATPVPKPTANLGKLVDRALKVGDTVQVTTDANQVLTVRVDPGRGANPVAKVPRGTRFTIKSGPVQADNLTWWELQGETVKGWAAEGDANSRWLTAVEP